jgi:hypothetical protein
MFWTLEIPFKTGFTVAVNLMKQKNLDEQVNKEMVTVLNQTCFKYKTRILQTQYTCFDGLTNIQHCD